MLTVSMIAFVCTVLKDLVLPFWAKIATLSDGIKKGQDKPTRIRAVRFEAEGVRSVGILVPNEVLLLFVLL